MKAKREKEFGIDKGESMMPRLVNMHGINVKLYEPGHVYKDENGNIYDSVSSVYSRYGSFDREGKSMGIARKQGKTQAQVLAEWDEKRDRSAVFGTRFHNAMEQYAYTKTIDQENEDFRELILKTESLFSFYKEQYMEQSLASYTHGIAGTADRLCMRGGGIVDIYDYKTNMEKGIEFVNKYGSYKLEPFEHLMDCNYVSYSLQLSIYAYMLETEYRLKIGRICIVDVSGGKYPVCLPVNYLKNDVIKLLEHRSHV